MNRFAKRRAGSVSAIVVVLFGLAGGIAYATIPDGGGVYTACRLNDVGTIRLIDPSLPASALLGHCTKLETQIQWNQQGQKGDPGAPGKSPTVAQLGVGDSHCLNGGAAITDANNSTAYVCNGTNGQDGEDFSGSFTSPDGRFTLSVSDNGVQVVGPDSSISLPSAGGVKVSSTGLLTIKVNDELVNVQHDANVEVLHDETHFVGHDRATTIDSNENVHVKHDLLETVDNNETTTVHGSRNEKVDAAFSTVAGGTFDLRAGLVTLNGGSSCSPVARVGDQVNASSVIFTGSATVCAGP